MPSEHFEIRWQFADFAREYGSLVRRVDQAIAGPGLPRAEARILLELRPEPKTAAQLVAALAMDRGQVSVSVKHLEAKGLLTRGPSPLGSKSKVIELTAAGKTKASE